MGQREKGKKMDAVATSPLTRASIAELLSSHAFASYLRQLRTQLGLTQKDVFNQLRGAPFFMRTHEKDMHEWEAAKRRPSAKTRAALIHVLGGSPIHADQLLLYTELVLSEGDTTVSSLLDENEQPVPEALARAIAEAEAYGAQLAREWLTDEQVRRLAQAAAQVDPALREEAVRLLEALAARSGDAARDFLRYGRFRLQDED